MTATTGNGWPVLHPGDPRLKPWVIPGANRRMTSRDDVLGFVVIYWATFWNDKVERLDGPGNDAVDEGCYAYRDIRGSSFASEHSGAAAPDLNWAKHPQGTPIRATFTKAQIVTIRRGIRYLNALAGGLVVRWGGEWPTHPGSTAKTDGMHTEFIHGRVTVLARRLARTSRGKRVLKANPWFKLPKRGA